MRALLYLVLLFSCYTTAAQNAVALGPSMGFGIPVMVQSNGEVDRPSQGAIFGLRLEITRSLGDNNLYFNTGVQAYIYYFSHSHVRYGTEPTGPLGLNIGIPINLQILLPVDRNSAFRIYGGLIPMIETGGLARASEEDGAIRPNIAPDLGANIFFSRSASIGFKWYMPIRLYGSNTLHSTYHLNCFTVDITRTLNFKKKRNKEQRHPYKRALG